MEVSWYLFLIIMGGAIVTMIPRVLPLVLLSKIQIPDWGIRWLSHIPVAVMAALLAHELLLPTSEFSILHNNLRLLAAVPALLVAYFTRSLLGTVTVGMLTMMALRWFT
ncbi:AzlD domain-containing protein [Paenibacillus sp. 481]|uniref:AzlD domain-containing protein n=1 Tax=Paenibacillus sp. 481 TaxID=2835869 RepID=UPI001E2C0EE7|nr:AzlD domain-containing protein [Paenibacillus sp. 481]UHA74819.1 AzlD domain-containing protein [Paenibacillus sp. 481]